MLKNIPEPPICLKTSGDWQNLRLLLDSCETSVGRVGMKNLNDMNKKKHGKKTKQTHTPSHPFNSKSYSNFHNVSTATHFSPLQ